MMKLSHLRIMDRKGALQFLKQLSINDTKWNCKLFQLFWWVFAVYQTASIASFIIILMNNPGNWLNFLIQIQLIPSASLLSILGLGVLVLRSFPHAAAYIVITMAVLFVVIFLIVIPELAGEYQLLCFPVVLSAIYYDSRKIVYSASFAFIIMILLYILDFGRGVAPGVFELIVSIVVISVSAFISYAIASRGIALLENLRHSMAREQELFAQSVQKDRLSKIDALTSLYNHRTFQEHTDYLLSSLSPDVRLELALMDIDDFKMINDTYGHLAGDQVLRTVSEQLVSFLTRGDFAFRYGGEEFAILFIEKTHDEAMEICGQLLQIFRETIIEEIPEHSLTVSIGVAGYQKGTPKDIWFKQADECLYAAKRNGKNRVADSPAS